MTVPFGRLAGFAAVLLVAALTGARAADIAPHRALYSMSLGSAKPSSGVLGASGAMVYEWGETCDGWTVQQRFRLRLLYVDSDPVELSSSLVSWESKDGRHYRFNERRLKNGALDEEVRGEARLESAEKGGTVEFTKPQSTTMALAPGALFPTAHTILLIDRAKQADNFISRYVFDGATLENASQITAVIGPTVEPAEVKSGGVKSPLLMRPSWRVRLAFFPANAKSDEPDYELGMRLFDNGVSTDMVLDYTDYVVRAKLDEIEPLPKPNC